MNDTQRNDLLRYLRDLEERIEAKRLELKAYADYRGISVGSVASIASELACLQTEQRTICFTLRQLSYYVVYNGSHATSIELMKED